MSSLPPARHLRWPGGQAWLAASEAQWPEALRARTPRATTARRTFAATAEGWPGAVAVRLAVFTASGGSYFAQAGATLRCDRGQGPNGGPSEGLSQGLQVCLEDPPTEAATDAATDLSLQDTRRLDELLLEGIAALALRPAGTLQLTRLTVHPVDFKAWAWRCCAATLVRLLCADVLQQSDEDLGVLALDVRAATLG